MNYNGTIEAIKQIATDVDGLNIKCYRGLMDLLGRERQDIILSIKKLRNSDPRKYTAACFTQWFDDMDKLIAKYDSLYNDKNIKAEYDLIDYTEKKIAYDCGESEEDPDAY